MEATKQSCHHQTAGNRGNRGNCGSWLMPREFSYASSDSRALVIAAYRYLGCSKVMGRSKAGSATKIVVQYFRFEHEYSLFWFSRLRIHKHSQRLGAARRRDLQGVSPWKVHSTAFLIAQVSWSCFYRAIATVSFLPHKEIHCTIPQ